MPTAHKAIFLLLYQWHQISSLDFESHAQFRKELNDFLNKASQLGDPYLEKVGLLKQLLSLPVRLSDKLLLQKLKFKINWRTNNVNEIAGMCQWRAFQLDYFDI